MRPRHVCLGCLAAVVYRDFNSCRFNEAEACLPRMHGHAAASASAVSVRFNEAEACLPRMPGRAAISSLSLNGLQ